MPPSDRAVPILAYLALAAERAPRPALVRLLWDDGRAVNLRQEIRKLRYLPEADRS